MYMQEQVSKYSPSRQSSECSRILTEDIYPDAVALADECTTMSDIYYHQIMSVEPISFQVSSPGKVILHGEHSVVYGRLAVAASLGLRSKLILNENHDSREFYLKLDFSEIDLKVTMSIKDIVSEILNGPIPLIAECSFYNFEHPEYVSQDLLVEKIEAFLENKPPHDSARKIALISFLYLYCAILWPSGIPLQTLEIEITSDISVGSGMGSSAAFAVSVTAALIQYIKVKYRTDRTIMVESFKLLSSGDSKLFTPRELQLISGWAFHAEKIIHGNPSGLDNSVCTYGSIVEYRKSVDPRPLRLNIRLTGLLVNTHVPKNTRLLIQKVAHLRDRLPIIVENTLDSMEIISHTAIDCMQKLSDLSLENSTFKGLPKEHEFAVHYDLLGDLVDINQNMLRILGVSHPSIDHICAILTAHGLHGKLTGAGGGGYVLALVPFYFDEEVLADVKAALKSEDYSCTVLELGGCGVMVDD